MFKNIDNFKCKKTGLQAFVFLILFGLLGMLIGAVSNIILAFVFRLSMDTWQDGLQTVNVTGKYIVLISGLYTSFITVIVAKSKNRLNKVSSVFSILISFLLSLFLGCFIGLIPSAIMTTKEPLDETDS